LNNGFSKKVLHKILVIYKRLFLKNILITDFDSDIKLSLKPNSSAGQLEYFLYYDAYDQVNFNFLRKFLKPGMVVVDIGANIGVYSLFFSKYVGKTGHVVSFEPYKQTFQHLLYNCKINDVNNIFQYNLAISNSNESRSFYRDAINDGANSFVQQDNMAGSETISTVIFDEIWEDFLNKKFNKIDLIKIDVEGWEIFVLKGMVKTVTENSPLILMEHNGFRYKSSSIDAFRFLSGLGYSCWELKNEKPIMISEAEISDKYDNVYIDFCYSKNPNIFNKLYNL
jgi:FkbM family methyltransferase